MYVAALLFCYKGNMVTGMEGTCDIIEVQLEGAAAGCVQPHLWQQPNLLAVLYCYADCSDGSQPLLGGLDADTWCYLGCCLTRSPAWPLEILRGWMLHPSTGDGVRS